MPTIFKTGNTDKAIIVLVLLFYVVFQFPYLHIDLWNDEIYTLKHFTFVPAFQTVTDYHVPNNHLLFNLINHFYLQLIGEENVYSLMDHPWVLRAFTLLYAAGTIYFTYKSAQLFFGKEEAILSIIILCTTLPFLNFALEIRGYCFTAFMLTANMYFIFRFIECSKWKFLLLVTTTAAAAVYAIPLCLYSMACTLLFSCILMIVFLLKKTGKEEILKKNKAWKKYALLITAVAAGIVLALFCYSPVIQDVFFNEYVVPDVAFKVTRWLEDMKNVLMAFFSHRYWLLPLLLAGMAGNIHTYFVYKDKRKFNFLFFLFMMLVFPFVISLIRKDAPPDRTFVNLIPFFSMLMAWMIHGVFFFFKNQKVHTALKMGIAVYCFTVLSFQENAVSAHLMNDIQTSRRSHDIYYNYYLKHFHPLSVVKKFKETLYSDSSFVVIRDSEPHDLPEYLNKYSIPIQNISLLDSALVAGKKVFLFSRYPNEILGDSFERQHSCRVKMVSEGVSYHNLFALEFRRTP